MPRTKRPTKVSKASSKGDSLQRQKYKAALEQKNKLDSLTQMELRNLDIKFKILMETIGSVDLQKTIGQLKRENKFDEMTTTLTSTMGTCPRSAGSQDDGYTSERSRGDSGFAEKNKFVTPGGRRPRAGTASTMSTASTTSTARRSRSAETRGSRAAGRPRAHSAYRTPAYNKAAALNYPMITPKVAPQSALTILRQPRQGEIALSLSGSPLAVSYSCGMKPEDKANCNIQLLDGTVLTMQPKHLRQSQEFIPTSLIDEKVRRQLNIIKENIEMVVKV